MNAFDTLIRRFTNRIIFSTLQVLLSATIRLDICNLTENAHYYYIFLRGVEQKQPYDDVTTLHSFCMSIERAAERRVAHNREVRFKPSRTILRTFRTCIGVFFADVDNARLKIQNWNTISPV